MLRHQILQEFHIIFEPLFPLLRFRHSQGQQFDHLLQFLKLSLEQKELLLAGFLSVEVFGGT